MHKIVAMAAALALSVAGAGAAAAATALVVAKASATADNMIPANVGDELGIFKKHGLDLKIVDFASGSRMSQAVIAGDIDIAVGAGSEMALIAKGAPMLAVCEDEGTFPFLSIGIAWDSPAKSLADLKGKKIGVSSAGSLTDWLAQQLARKEGWGPNGVVRVAAGSSTEATTAALRGHLVDAYINGTSMFLSMAEKKLGRVLVPVSDFQGDSAAGDIYAPTRLIQSNPDAIRAFLAAWLETIRYMRAHKDETVAIESRITSFSPTVMAQEYDITIGMFSNDCRFSPQALAILKQSFLDLKLVSTPPDMTKLYTEAFLPK